MGELHLERARPEVTSEWTDSNSRSEERGLKHRGLGEGRTVRCPPELTALPRAPEQVRQTRLDNSYRPLSASEGGSWLHSR
jgi:hypothetical protein